MSMPDDEDLLQTLKIIEAILAAISIIGGLIASWRCWNCFADMAVRMQSSRDEGQLLPWALGFALMVSWKLNKFKLHYIAED